MAVLGMTYQTVTIVSVFENDVCIDEKVVDMFEWYEK